MLFYEWLNDVKYITKSLYRLSYDGFLYIVGSKEERNFIKKVPLYCRYECRYVYICRNEDKNWKCRKGCIKITGYDPNVHHL